MSYKLLAISLTLALVVSIKAKAAVVAVIDSGNDFKHKDLAAKAWVNPVEIADNDRDEDRNGYQDDVNGWNFAEGNNQLIDYNYAGSYNENTKKFFDVQLRYMMGTMSEEERTWIKEKTSDETFMKELQVFGNWMHGTHVTGIAVRGADEAHAIGIKLIPTEVKLPGQKINKLHAGNQSKDVKDFLLKQGLKALAVAQSKTFSEIGSYVANVKADVANGSFGTPNSSISGIIAGLYKSIFKKDPTAEDLKVYVDHYFTEALAASKVFLTSSPKTLFVFAAGNEGTDNDVYPTSPANIDASNKIVVAATMFNRELATFSNYGVKNVDVAAPGVGIISTIPMDHAMAVSGTSQAAPYVANVAGRVKDENAKLSAEEIREIIMGTVDVKPWLKGKVKSGGIVNPERAIRAGLLSQTMSVKLAIQNARKDILDMPAEGFKKTNFARDLELEKLFVTPMPNPFKIVE